MSLERELRAVPVFRDLGDADLAWLASRARVVELESGEALISEGEPADAMFAVLEGEIRGRRERGAPDGLLYVLRKGDVSGMLPHSRMTHYPITARSVGSSRLALFGSDGFPEMLKAVPILESRLASVMADRVKETTEQSQLRERLIGLGKLSAGLAHELNNPAAAIARSIDGLQMRVEGLSELIGRLLAELAGATPIDGLLALKDFRMSADEELDALARMDAEDELSEWLASQGVPEPWVAAETFASGGIRRAQLEGLAGAPEPLRSAALRWLEAHISSRQLMGEIAESAARISGVVTAVKGYSHMDRGPSESEVDIVAGLESTLAVLAHKLRDKQLHVSRDYGVDLPGIPGNAGELNQVWTNLLDNAIDASPVGGSVHVRVFASAAEVAVQIVDEGEGIPAEIVQRVFEPFFTTKDVGQGTGLGLDIAKRIVTAHRGEMRVESAPGRTSFEVRIPARA